MTSTDVVTELNKTAERGTWQLLLCLNVFIHLLGFTAIPLTHGTEVLNIRLPPVRQTEVTDGHLTDALPCLSVNISTCIVEGVGIDGTYLIEHIIIYICVLLPLCVGCFCFVLKICDKIRIFISSHQIFSRKS